MNDELEKFARSTIKIGLSQCNEKQQLLFKRIYSHENIELPINEVVEKMPAEKLDWAMKQVSNTLSKNESKPL
jgi:hypothetical protein